jgi:hypothetical protein
MSNFAIVTYTNSNCKDVWPVYFGQLDKHAPWLKSYVFSDVNPNCKNHEFIEYDAKQPYYVQWLKCIEQVPEKYVIYAQEDFILFGDVNRQSFDKFIEFMEEMNYDYVRPFRCGYDCIYESAVSNRVKDNLYDIDVNCRDAFMMQITLWNKEKLCDVYMTAKSVKWFEAQHWLDAVRALKIKGAFTYDGEQVRGAAHYDSIHYPYICTAINRGKWNFYIYGFILPQLLQQYGIDYSKRGARYAR